MKYRIVGSTMPAVEVVFDTAGESMYTQSGGMAWMSDGIEMNTNTNGGFLKGVGRMFAGESLFMANYTATRPGASIAFASTVAGEIFPVNIGETGGLICQKGAFLCAQESVTLSVALTKKLSAGLFGGEGFILQDISFSVRKGERISLVGLNGSGKSTMVKLLCRLYSVSKGVIKVNGRNIEEYKYSDYIKL